MDNLKDIVDNIKDKKLDRALELCETNENSANRHIILNFKGVINLLKNELDNAEKNFLDSCKIKKDFEDPIKNLYLIYLKKKNYKDVLLYAKKLLAINKTNHQYNYQLAYAYELNDDLIEAVNYYEIYINLNGKDKKKALNNIGNIFLKKNKLKDSLNYFLKALDLDQNDKLIINNILLNYIKLRDEENSDLYFRKAKIIDENYIEFVFNNAEYFILKNQIQKAIEILSNHKDKTKFLIRLIKLLFDTGRRDKGKILLSDSRNKIKNDATFYNYLGLRSLYEGNFDDGWKYYEFRRSKSNDLFKHIKEWDGEKIHDKKIVVYNEQGIGDSIQFSKYLIPLSKISNKITFFVQDSIYNLFKKDFPNISIETSSTIKDKNFDYKVALGSLLKTFYKKSINETIIFSSKNNILKWKNTIDNSKLNVGLVWSGSFNGPNEPYRSIPLKLFNKIFTLDANFYCLQNEIWDRDLDYFKSLKLIDYGKYKLDEISSIVSNLDLVISVDTSILHLSASLKTETWGLFNIYPDWRWGEFNKFNPYKTLKMFHQNNFNNWDDIQDQIFEELKQKIR